MRLVFVLLALLCSCSLSGQPDAPDPGSINMRIDSRNIKSWCVRKKDIWTKTLLPTQQQIIEYYQSLINLGYVIYDAPASGALDLSALATGNYIVCWKTNNPTSTFTVSANTTKSGAHNVVILPIKLNSSNQITAINLNPTFDIVVTYNFAEKLKFSYGKFTMKSSSGGYTPESIVFDSCYIIGYIGSPKNCKFSNIEFEITDFGSPYYYGLTWYFTYSVDADFINCRWRFTGAPTTSNGIQIDITSGAIVQMINCEFLNQSSTQNTSIKLNATSAQIFNFQNTYIENASLFFASYVTQNNDLPIYIDNPLFSGGYINNYLIIPYRIKDESFIIGNDVLDEEAILDTNNYTNRNALHTDKKSSFRGTISTIKRTSQMIEFLPNKKISAALKYFDDYDLNVDWQEEEDDILVNDPSGAFIIKNYKLYESDGTTEMDYRNDKNFIIIAQDSSGNYADFAWYKGYLYPTIFRSIWPATEYTILMCIQLKEPPADVELRNIYPIADSPLAGSITYQDMTSQVIIP